MPSRSRSRGSGQNNVTVTADRFTYALDGILDGVTGKVEDALEPAVRSACSKGAREVRRQAKAKLLDTLGGQYKKSFTWTVKKARYSVVGTIGSRKYPSLVHLVEKGHAKMGGGRVPPYTHMAEGADVAFDELERRVQAAVGEATR